MTDHMQYLPYMENIGPDIQDKVLTALENYDPASFSADDVRAALDSEICTPENYMALLSPAADSFLEEMAKRAMQERARHFGNSVYMFTPLYISNYCENRCVYCNFNGSSHIRRARLDTKDMEREMQAIAQSGLQEILILTGESRKFSDVEYIGEACRTAAKYFRVTGLEVYPMNSDEYRYLRECGADFVTVFQETYNSDRYEQLHPAGNKRVFPYRFNAQERALMGGMRGVGFGALLGLDDFRKDAFAAGYHAHLIQKKYPHAEISMSCPRLRPISTDSSIGAGEVGERQLLQTVLAYRIFLPYAGITVSTRERGGFRDNVIKLAATKISAGVSVGIGGHSASESKGDGQFEISDTRTVEQVQSAALNMGLQPVMSEYIYV